MGEPRVALVPHIGALDGIGVGDADRVVPVGATLGRHQHPATARPRMDMGTLRPSRTQQGAAPDRPRLTPRRKRLRIELDAVSYTHLRAHETDSYLVCRL